MTTLWTARLWTRHCFRQLWRGSTHHTALEIMRSSLGPTVGREIAQDLRAHIAWLDNALTASDVDETAQPRDRKRLLASMCEAIAHIEDWAERHGIEACGTLVEDSAERTWLARRNRPRP